MEVVVLGQTFRSISMKAGQQLLNVLSYSYSVSYSTLFIATHTTKARNSIRSLTL